MKCWWCGAPDLVRTWGPLRARVQQARRTILVEREIWKCGSCRRFCRVERPLLGAPVQACRPGPEAA